MSTLEKWKKKYFKADATITGLRAGKQVKVTRANLLSDYLLQGFGSANDFASVWNERKAKLKSERSKNKLTDADKEAKLNAYKRTMKHLDKLREWENFKEIREKLPMDKRNKVERSRGDIQYWNSATDWLKKLRKKEAQVSDAPPAPIKKRGAKKIYKTALKDINNPSSDEAKAKKILKNLLRPLTEHMKQNKQAIQRKLRQFVTAWNLPSFTTEMKNEARSRYDEVRGIATRLAPQREYKKKERPPPKPKERKVKEKKGREPKRKPPPPPPKFPPKEKKSKKKRGMPSGVHVEDINGNKIDIQPKKKKYARKGKDEIDEESEYEKEDEEMPIMKPIIKKKPDKPTPEAVKQVEEPKETLDELYKQFMDISREADKEIAAREKQPQPLFPPDENEEKSEDEDAKMDILETRGNTPEPPPKKRVLKRKREMESETDDDMKSPPRKKVKFVEEEFEFAPPPQPKPTISKKDVSEENKKVTNINNSLKRQFASNPNDPILRSDIMSMLATLKVLQDKNRQVGANVSVEAIGREISGWESKLNAPKNVVVKGKRTGFNFAIPKKKVEAPIIPPKPVTQVKVVIPQASPIIPKKPTVDVTQLVPPQQTETEKRANLRPSKNEMIRKLNKIISTYHTEERNISHTQSMFHFNRAIQKLKNEYNEMGKDYLDEIEARIVDIRNKPHLTDIEKINAENKHREEIRKIRESEKGWADKDISDLKMLSEEEIKKEVLPELRRRWLDYKRAGLKSSDEIMKSLKRMMDAARNLHGMSPHEQHFQRLHKFLGDVRDERRGRMDSIVTMNEIQKAEKKLKKLRKKEKRKKKIRRAKVHINRGGKLKFDKNDFKSGLF